MKLTYDYKTLCTKVVKLSGELNDLLEELETDVYSHTSADIHNLDIIDSELWKAYQTLQGVILVTNECEFRRVNEKLWKKWYKGLQQS